MAEILWLNWSGGGNLPPSLGIARELTGRGHVVIFAGRPEMVPRVERAGFRAMAFSRAYELADRYPNKWIPRAASYLTSPPVAEQIRELIASERPDLVIIDAMFPAALVEAAQFPCPTIVMCHTCVHRMLSQWQQMLALLVNLRSEAGFGAWSADLDEIWMTRDKLVVTTLKALDPPRGGLANPEKIRHVGPVLERERHMQGAALPWPQDDPTPLVLVSFSTMPEQGSVTKFQNAIDALGELPVHGVVTVSDSIDSGALQAAPNVAVLTNADHDELMRCACLVVTHGGHGTMMRALKHGLPMVVMPGLASDQPVNAASVEAWGAGLAIAGDANAAAIRSAVGKILAVPSYRIAAARLAREFDGVDGAANAADEIEQLLARSQLNRGAAA